LRSPEGFHSFEGSARVTVQPPQIQPGTHGYETMTVGLNETMMFYFAETLLGDFVSWGYLQFHFWGGSEKSKASEKTVSFFGGSSLI
jgi:hypothetical protein